MALPPLIEKLLIFISTALAAIQIHDKTKHDHIQILEEVGARSLAVDNLIASLIGHLNLMQNKAETFFLDVDQVDNSKLFQALSNRDDNFYGLDNIPAPYSDINVGNLTGKGKITDISKSLKQEIEMSLNLNSLFQATKKNIPNSAWIYYTSKNNFINIYPWVDSGQSRFSEELYTHEFYKWGTPSENPEKKIFWTPIYIDEYGSGKMVTAAKPIYREEEFLGTVAIDITLDRLTDYVVDLKETDGTFMIVNQQNQLIAHPSLASSASGTINTLENALPESLRSEAGSLFENPQLRLARQGGCLYAWYAMKNAPWKIVFILREQHIFMKMLSMSGTVFFVLLAALLVMLFTTKKITSQEFIRPAENLVRHIAKESANEPSPLPDVPAPWIPWFTEISRIFTENRNLIKEVIETTAANERIQSELNVAREIQMGTLPTDFSFEPERKEVDIYACLFPAREVGGDLYDFFFVDEEHLCFTVGDVAGKGVPAALFMVITKELISNNVLLGNLSPADVMTWINEMLYRGNPSAMFVTLFIGILNVKTGMVHYANGGHVPPIFT